MRACVVWVAAAAWAAAGSAPALASSTGSAPGMAGAPGEQSCLTCHGGYPLNPDSQGRIALTGAPAVYEPGKVYPLTLQISHPAAARWGFQATAIARDQKGAGDFAPLPGDRTTQRKSGSNGRVYIEHGGPGRLATGIGAKGGFTWKFNWTAPAANVGPISFYAAANMANADNSNTGDKIYTGGGKPLAVSRGK